PETGDFVASSPNARAADNTRGLMSRADVGVGWHRCVDPSVLRNRAAAATGLVLRDDPALSARRAAAGRRGFQWQVDADLVVNRARDRHSHVVLLPGPAGGDGLFVANQ